MAVRQINTADYDYAMMLETINKSYKGKADITISEYTTSAAPDVKVGSVWEDNGAIFILETADMTPAVAGYNAIANSTDFYLVYDVSASVFIFSSSAYTWSDALQGFYNGNDRAFFKMYKDAGGTLYQQKRLLLPQNNYEVDGFLKYDCKRITSDNYIAGATTTSGTIFTKLSPFIPNIGDEMLLSGSIDANSACKAVRNTATQILIPLIQCSGAGGVTNLGINEGAATTHLVQFSW